MANIMVRRNGEQQAAPAAEWDPMRFARELMGWDPFRQMAPLFATEPSRFLPAFDVKETKEGYLFRADLPGVAQKDIDVTVQGNRLQVSGKREADHEEKTDTYYTYERTTGSFSRSFTLPDGADTKHIRADLKEGVLTILVNRSAEAQPRKIAITPEASKPKS